VHEDQNIEKYQKERKIKENKCEILKMYLQVQHPPSLTLNLITNQKVDFSQIGKM
jgi:hypothetical protein